MTKLLKTLLLISFFSFPTLFLSPDVSAQFVARSCHYQSTQSRVKRVGYQPWEQHLYLTCGESFEVGGFHDQTGQYAHDTKIRVTGPGIDAGRVDGEHIFNGQSFTTSVNPGRNEHYTVRVRTRGMDGSACEDYSYVNVTCPAPTHAPTHMPTHRPTFTPYPQPTHHPITTPYPPMTATPAPKTCHYSSTQARVKHDSRDTTRDQNWQQSLSINCFDAFEVGGFHDETGRYAEDVKIRVEGPYMNWGGHHNGDRIHVAFPGDYTVHVKTKDQSGHLCEDTARVRVSCDWGWKWRGSN